MVGRNIRYFLRVSLSSFVIVGEARTQGYGGERPSAWHVLNVVPRGVSYTSCGHSRKHRPGHVTADAVLCFGTYGRSDLAEVEVKLQSR